MAKVMIVEDDNNLREIYSDALTAEGYDVVSAADGEEALATAVKEKPDLLILDVMMPKISGFDVLDILRSTPETKQAKIMMMTALSQQSDKERGQRLGADRYLVKSQVTIPDIISNVTELLNSADAPATQAGTPADGTAPIDVPDLPVGTVESPSPAPEASPAPAQAPPVPAAEPTTVPEPAQPPAPAEPAVPVSTPPQPTTPTPQVPDMPAAVPTASVDPATPAASEDTNAPALVAEQGAGDDVAAPAQAPPVPAAEPTTVPEPAQPPAPAEPAVPVSTPPQPTTPTPQVPDMPAAVPTASVDPATPAASEDTNAPALVAEQGAGDDVAAQQAVADAQKISPDPVDVAPPAQPVEAASTEAATAGIEAQLENFANETQPEVATPNVPEPAVMPAPEQAPALTDPAPTPQEPVPSQESVATTEQTLPAPEATQVATPGAEIQPAPEAAAQNAPATPDPQPAPNTVSPHDIAL